MAVPATRPVETVAAALAGARSVLAPSPTASLDAQILLAYVMQRTRAWVLAHGDHSMSSHQAAEYHSLIRRRSRGEPVAYLRGEVEWWDVELAVDSYVLVPRPESEVLVQEAIAVAERIGARLIADVGTGSGALAVALARGLPGCRILATDSSARALRVAAGNIRRYHLDSRVDLALGSLLEPMADCPDVVVANLPYLSDAMMDEIGPDVRHEPRSALHGGHTGLELYADLARQIAIRRWRPHMLVEIDPRQAAEVKEMLERALPGGRVDLIPDLAGLTRVAIYRPSAGEES